ncbi:MAG: efflux RND transporter periplasmic adaptor subunit [Planctomycetota bacterium]|jgi:RND family efflux transporter MFP subunit
MNPHRKHSKEYGIILAILAMIFSFGCTPKEPPKVVEKPKKVAVEIIETTLIEDRITLPGEAVAMKSVMLAAETAGKVEWIKLRPDGTDIDGADVKEDDCIVKIDSRLAKAQLVQAQTAVELANTAYHVQAKVALELANETLIQAAAGLELANATYRRKAALADMGSGPVQDLDKARTGLTQAISGYESALLGMKSAEAGRETARLRLQQALAGLVSAEIMCEKSFLKSPFDGLVATVLVEKGAYVGPGTPVARVIVIDKVKLIIQAPEGDFSRIDPKLSVTATISALESAQFTGNVTRIPDTANPMTRTFPVEVTLDNPGRRIKPGMIAKVKFILATFPRAIVIPTNTIIPVGEEYLVFVAGNNNDSSDSNSQYIARRRKVTLGVMEEDRFQITSGLEAGDVLIVKGHQNLIEGQELEIVSGLPGSKSATEEQTP